jgi:beta propeller repeat protein
MKKTKKLCAIFVCLLFLGTILAGTFIVVAPKPPGKPGGGKEEEPGTEYQITEGLHWDGCPYIDGNLIAWHAYTTSSRLDLFLYDLGADGIPFTSDDGGETQLTDTITVSEDTPRIYGNKIVFRRDHGTTQEVRDMCLYDLNTDTVYQLTENVDFRTHDIYENLIVYWIWKPGPIRELWLYDLGTDGVPSEDDSNYKLSDCDGSHWPKIDGNKVIFEWNDDLNIYYLSGSNAGQTAAMGLNYRPVDLEIHGNRIVWSDNRNVNYDVFTYDLGFDGIFGTSDDGGEQQLSTTRDGEGRPVVYGDKIVWHKFINKGPGKWNVYLKDLITGKTHTITTSNDAHWPCIYNDHIVYYDDREGIFDIYLYILD